MELGALRTLALSGGEWVIHLLLACSVLTVAVIIERALVQSREKKGLDALRERLSARIDARDWPAAARDAAAADGSAARVLAAGLSKAASGWAAVEEHLAAARLVEKKRLETRLLILGSLGNNAPFIGLFGTVLGVIKAFNDLAATAAAGPEVVMQGLAEALIATAVGLLVAIPAVMAYNYLQKRVNDLLDETDALSRRFLAELKAEKRAGA
jgi:biopolymer transport protein ExbB